MNIERLKELKSWVSDLRKFGVSEGNEIIVLIGEAIARQSVKREDVAEAIEEMAQASDRAHYSQDGNHVKLPVSLKTIDLAIAALQAYQPWVMVSVEKPETYPPNGKVVLLKMSNAQYPVIGHYSKTFENFKTLTGGEYPVSIVTHYKSLPQPPKGE